MFSGPLTNGSTGEPATEGRSFISSNPPGSHEIAALLRSLERDPVDPEPIRREVAALIFRDLWRRRDNPLSPWEKMHYEMAIALLPTVWLRLCLVHLKMAADAPADHAQKQFQRAQGGELEKLTLEELLERLKRLAIGD